MIWPFPQVFRPQTHIQTQLSTVHQFVLIKTKCKEFCISILDVILWFYDDTRACIGYISQTFWHMLAVPVYQKSLDWWSYGVSIFFSSVISLAVWACLLSMLHESGQLKRLQNNYRLRHLHSLNARNNE